jgi:hypothetical protein
VVEVPTTPSGFAVTLRQPSEATNTAMLIQLRTIEVVVGLIGCSPMPMWSSYRVRLMLLHHFIDDQKGCSCSNGAKRIG